MPNNQDNLEFSARCSEYIKEPNYMLLHNLFLTYGHARVDAWLQGYYVGKQTGKEFRKALEAIRDRDGWAEDICFCAQEIAKHVLEYGEFKNVQI